MSEDNRPKNLILTSLSAATLERVSNKLEPIELNLGDHLYDPGDMFTHVYFVESGIVAILVVADEHSTLQCCMDGNEAMVGVPVFLGIDVAANPAVVQASGAALQMKVADFRAECSLRTDLHQAIERFTYATISHIARTAACNRFHSTDARMAKWLMKTQDRLKTDTFSITQEFLSYMLGVRREAINKIARDFQRLELISYSRGNFSITHRKGLESIVCNCYQPIMN